MSAELKVGFIGAGNANFGGGEGPWDHASRLERIDGLRVVGVADLNTARAEQKLAPRRSGPAAGMYADARIFDDFRAMLSEARPDVVFIGLPPHAHGRTDPPHDAELACAAAGVHFLLEKPLGSVPPERLGAVVEAIARAGEDGLIVSVGYMFRYSRAVEKMREIIAATPGAVRLVSARYDCAYSEIASSVWWDMRFCGGPIIEQATHFCDLARLLGGEVDLASVAAVTVDPGGPAGGLVDVPAGADGRSIEAGFPAEFRIPRATAAVWRFLGGAVGTLAHGVLLHGKKYAAEIEVWGDGLRMVLTDPYGACRLEVRSPGGEDVETFSFDGDDPYQREDETFIQAVRGGDASAIRSTYADAVRTYELTWAIRRAGEA